MKIIRSIIFFSLGFIVGDYFIDKLFNPKLNAPEEWRAISTNPTTPDTMLVYKTGSTIHLLFKGKHR